MVRGPIVVNRVSSCNPYSLDAAFKSTRNTPIGVVRVTMKPWIIGLTSLIIGIVSALFVATLLQNNVSRPVSMGLASWVQFVWMIPVFLSLSEIKRRNNSSKVPGTILMWLLAITVAAGAIAGYKYFVWSG